MENYQVSQIQLPSVISINGCSTLQIALEIYQLLEMEYLLCISSSIHIIIDCISILLCSFHQTH